MKRILTLPVAALFLLCLMVATGCDSSQYAASDQIIIAARDLPQYIGKENTVIVDMQAPDAYAEAHVTGAVNIPVAGILVSLPVPNSLAPKGKVSATLGKAGIGNDTLAVIYDEGKSLNASRLWWTMLVYGHANVKVVDGGLPAIKKAGISLTAEAPVVKPREFTAGDNRKEYLATLRDIRKQVDDPDPDVVLLDTRTDKEYAEEGKIPGSVMMDHIRNFYKDRTFFDTRATRINYIERGIRAEKTVIMYCKTSMRAAAVFLRLYDAGYRRLKLYDGAWTEWSANSNNPVERPSGAVAPSPRDNS